MKGFVKERTDLSPDAPGNIDRCAGVELTLELPYAAEPLIGHDMLRDIDRTVPGPDHVLEFTDQAPGDRLIRIEPKDRVILDSMFGNRFLNAQIPLSATLQSDIYNGNSVWFYTTP